MTYCLAFDLGSTKTLIGLVDDDGNTKEVTRKPSIFPIDYETFIAQLLFWIAEYRVKYDFSSIALGMRGQINSKAKLLMATCDSDELLNIPVGAELKAATKLNVYVENDGVTALLGELWKGAGSEYRNVLMLTIGTGLGGATTNIEHPLKGMCGTALQVGHMTFKYDGYSCDCGKKGCAEKYISGTAIQETYCRLTGKHLPTEQIFIKYHEKEAAAKQVIQQFLKLTATYIASLANLLNPELIILGGGVSNSLEYYEIQYIEDLAKQSALVSNRNFKVVRAAHRNYSGILGAAYLAHQLQ